MNRQEKRRLQREEEKENRMGLENTNSNKLTIKYICLQCKMEEEIPKSVVDNFDAMDDGDLSVPPRFTCNKCHGGRHLNIKREAARVSALFMLHS